MKTWLAFCGSNATYGTPNPRTGRHSQHGYMKAFDSKKERDEFCDVFSNEFCSYPTPTNKQKAKSMYFAGMTHQQYDEVLNLLLANIIEEM